MSLNQSSGVTSEKCAGKEGPENDDIEPHRDEKNQESETGPQNELRFQDQSSRMPLRKILVVYLGIGKITHPEVYHSSFMAHN